MKASFAARFFLLAFLITWGVWGFLVLNGTTLDPGSPTYLLFILGGFGPSMAGWIMTAISGGRTGLRDLWRRTIRFKFGLQWYLIIFLLFPLINALTLLVTNAIGGPSFDFALAFSLSVAPNLMVPFLISSFFFGALAEEFGWRGYALDRLQARFGPALGSLLLGVLWGIWHLPLFYISGAPQHNLHFHPSHGSERDAHPGDHLRCDSGGLAPPKSRGEPGFGAIDRLKELESQ